MKIVSIVGARPQFIKLAPLSKKIREFHDEIIIHTGQHYDKNMSNAFFEDLKINRPKYNLNINGGLHGFQTARMIEEIEKILIKEKPKAVIIFGDTNTTLAASVAASKLDCVVFHVESGLRSFNRSMPEEINRIVADHLSDYLFCPTDIAMKNLSNENLIHKSYLTGDIMVDSIKYALGISQNRNILKKYKLETNKFYLLTLHRPYNVDNPLKMKKILNSLSSLDYKVLFPIHPRTKNIFKKNNLIMPNNIIVIDPLSYLDFINIQKNSKKIITDSGGIQKEAYILKKPCITLRSETEWVETVESGWNLLLNPDIDKNISSEIKSYNCPLKHEPLFGGNVSGKMVNIINNLL